MDLHPPTNTRAPRNMDSLVAAATRSAGFAVAPGDAALVLMDVDIDALYAEHAARVRWAIWDKETDINGVAPERVMARADYGGGEIYLIYIDGQLVFLQPHAPNGSEPVSEDDVEDIAGSHAADIVNEYVFADLIGRVVGSATPPDQTVSMSDLREVLRQRGRQ